MSDQSALHGVKVLELGHGIAGPFAARLLGDFGAEVVKVEKPGRGDFVRDLGPAIADSDGNQVGLLFEQLNWNKRSVALDLGSATDRDVVLELVEWADIIVCSFRPGRLEDWGLGPDELRARNPRAVLTMVSNFGQDGPYAGREASDLIFQAFGGVMQISGFGGAEPLKPGLQQSLYCAGINAAYVTVFGYLQSQRTGSGPVLDLSIAECVSSQLVLNEPYYAFLGVVQGRRPRVSDPLSGDPLATADGYLSLQTNSFTPLARLTELLGNERFADPRWRSAEGRSRHAPELRALLDEHLRDATSRDLFVKLCGAGFLAGFVQGAHDLLTCPQLDSRDAYHVVDDLRVGGEPVKFPARLVTMSVTPTSVRTPAPRTVGGAERPVAIGEHRARPTSPPSPGSAPLTGLRVIDLSTVFAVPYLGGLLADLGAEVIKVEAPRRLDQTRSGFGAPFDNDPRNAYWNRATTFQVLNRGKRSVAIDLTTEDGRAVLREMIASADILLDNFTPRVMRGWKLTYEDLRTINPRLIMLSNTGYGSTGPWASFKAQGTTLEATMGLMHYTGYPGPEPQKAGQSYPDFLACWTGLLALGSALVHRQRTDEGQWIDLGMYQLGISVIPEALLHFQARGSRLPRSGNAELGALLSGLFAARGVDRWLAVSIAREDQLTGLGKVVPAVAELLVGPIDDASKSAIVEALSAYAADRSPEEAARHLQDVGIAASPVNNAKDLLLDEHIRARGFYEWVDFGPELGRRPLVGRPYRWRSADGYEPHIASRAPCFAADNDSVFSSAAPKSARDLERLRAEGVVVDRPVDPPSVVPVVIASQLARGAFASVDEDYVQILRSIEPPSDSAVG